jgi:hypothetical protein
VDKLDISLSLLKEALASQKDQDISISVKQVLDAFENIYQKVAELEKQKLPSISLKQFKTCTREPCPLKGIAEVLTKGSEAFREAIISIEQPPKTCPVEPCPPKATTEALRKGAEVFKEAMTSLDPTRNCPVEPCPLKARMEDSRSES